MDRNPWLESSIWNSVKNSASINTYNMQIAFTWKEFASFPRSKKQLVLHEIYIAYMYSNNILLLNDTFA